MKVVGYGELDCPFFAGTCRLALADYLSEYGLTEQRLTPGGGIVFRDSDMFVEIGYDVNLFPDYPIRVTIGLGERAYSDTARFSGVPMWYIISTGHPYRTKVHWTFRTAGDLTRVLAEVRTDFLAPIAIPLLRDHEALERVSRSFHAEFG